LNNVTPRGETLIGTIATLNSAKLFAYANATQRLYGESTVQWTVDNV